MNYVSIAVDGPAGAGKSSVSKAVAKELGFIYIDTGAMYRAAALYMIQCGIDPSDAENVNARLDEIDIRIEHAEDGQTIYLNGKDVTKAIRREEVSVGASNIAVNPEVRERLVAMQRKMAEKSNVIMDGRDICSTVLPNAQVKVFLTASVEERASRRYKELTEKGVECDFEKIKKDIEYRDKNDSSRAVSPLKKTDDAVLVDTTELSFDEAVEKIKELARNVL